MAEDANAEGLDLEELSDPDLWRGWADAARQYVETQVLTTDTFVQLAAVAATVVLAWALRGPLALGLGRAVHASRAERLAPRLRSRVVSMTAPVLLLVLAIGARAIVEQLGYGAAIMRIVISLAAAWTIIRFATQFISEPYWAKLAAQLAWIGAILNIFGLLGPLIGALDRIGFTVGEDRLTLWIILQSAVLVALLLAFAGWLSKALRRRIQAIPKLEPSLQILFSTTIQVALIVAAVLIGLAMLNIPLTAFAVFGGAIGLGLGFGLQKVVSNFVSGIILLLDRSIKPGDVIEVTDSYGWVNSLGLRYASIVTRDGHEHLIPNELLMTEKVVNWSFSSKAVRVKRSIGIAYGSDVKKAIELVIEAAKAAPRTVANPAPKCLLIGFGDSAVELEVRFWIEDPENGVRAAAHDVLLNVWEAFKENGVEIPFPQRDLNFKGGEPVEVRVVREE